MSMLVRAVAKLPVNGSMGAAANAAGRVVHFSTRGPSDDGDSRNSSSSTRNTGAGGSTVYRRSAEAKGAMKSFFDTTGAGGDGGATRAGAASTPASSTGASIWQRLKRDAGSRILSNRTDGGASGRDQGSRPEGGGGRGGGRGYQGGRGGFSGSRSSGGDGRPQFRSNNNMTQGGGGSAGAGGGYRFREGGRGGGGFGGPGGGDRRPAFNRGGRGGFGGRGAGGERRGRQGGGNREDRQQQQSYDVGEIEHSLLNDYEYFDQLFAKGGHIQNRYMDPVDTLLSEVFEESFKTKDGSVMTVMELQSDAAVRTEMTHMKARPMSQLLTHSIMPDIHTATPGTFAHQTATYAWEAISKNPYYTEHQRNWMCNKIAKLTDRAFSFEPEKFDYISDDQVLDPNFRYGAANMPEEELEFESRRKMLTEMETNDKGITKLMRRTRQEDVLEQSLKYFVTPDVQQYFTVDQMTFEEEQAENQRRLKEQQMREGQAETDWSVEAVVDEDQL